MLYNLLFNYAYYPFHYKVIIFLTFTFAVVAALTFHEFAHAFTAHKLGDNTAKMAGRLTLNPMAHFDRIGLLCFLFLGFGWAKPVPINTFNFKKIKRDTFLVSISGILVNLLLAFIFCPIAMLLEKYVEASIIAFIFYALSIYLFQINLVFMVFNLLPIYPLDGFNAIASQLKYTNPFVSFMQRYGSIVLLAVILIFNFTNVFGYLVNFVGSPISKFWRLII